MVVRTKESKNRRPTLSIYAFAGEMTQTVFKTNFFRNRPDIKVNMAK
jgi:hypothetical protein